MARKAGAAPSVEEILRAAVEQVLTRTAGAIEEAVAASIAAELRRNGASRGARAAAPPRRRRPPRKEMTRWVADNRARRVPNFVIGLTGLDTKKKIVAKFGPNARFEIGKPAPPALADGAASPARPRESRAAGSRSAKRSPAKTAAPAKPAGAAKAAAA